MRMTKKLDRQSPSLIKACSGINLKTIMATPHIIPSEPAIQKLNKREKCIMQLTSRNTARRNEAGSVSYFRRFFVISLTSSNES